MQVRLVVEKARFDLKDLPSTSIEIGEGQSIAVGRSDADFALPDQQLSRLHFRLSCSGESCSLQDLDTRYGTYVNGTRVHEIDLENADVVQAGWTTFAVEFTGAPAGRRKQEEEQAPLPPSKAPAPPDETYRILNQTPLQFACIAGQVDYPRHSLTVVLKGTFDLHPGATMTPAEEQPPTTGDELYADDEEGLGGCRYESDMAIYKPRGDLLFVGSCYAPNGEAATCPATFRVGDHSRTLIVHGDRHWEGGEPSEPVPFSKVELRYENSYGGSSYPRNPVGIGYERLEFEDGRTVVPMPNIEDPEHQSADPGQNIEPAGFGPLGKQWAQRKPLLGTYDDAWVESRWPWFAEDLDWSYFNAAPPPMQVDGFLKGDEEILLHNLHPKHATFHTRLPGRRIRCFLNDETGTDAFAFREIPLNLDTVWVDGDAAQAVLVWRGLAAIRSEEFPDLRHVFITSESLRDPPHSHAECQAAFQAALAAWEAQFEEVPAAKPEPPAAGPEEPEEPEEPDEIDLKVQQHVDKSTAEARAKCEEAGIDPDNPPMPTEEELEEAKRILKEHGIEVPELEMEEEPVPPAWTRESVQQWAAEGNSFEGEALARIDLSGLNLSGADFTKADLGGASLVDCVLDGADFAGARLAGADLSGASAIGANFSGAGIRLADLRRINARDAVFTEADLRGATAASASLEGAKINKANLTGIDLAGANLSLSNLAGTDMSGANFEKAQLADCDLADANLTGALLTEATLSEAILTGANLARADLRRVQASSANFSAADLTSARLADGEFFQADFSKCNLERCSFERARLLEATLEGAQGAGINCTRADLTRVRASQGCDFSYGKFREAVAPDSAFGKAVFDGADLAYAHAPGSDFSGASFVGANLYASDMKQSRFRKANLQQARLVRMNVFEGIFEKADLTEANISGSNMFGAEFVGAVLENVEYDESTNLKRSKLYTG